MRMRIRVATLDDVGKIMNLHTIGENFSGHSVMERYSKGGPWMSLETLAIHLNNLLLDGQLVAIAELDGNVVGEVEVLFSEEPILGEMRRIAHIDVIEVHPDYRGKGIGRSLLEFVEEIARENRAEFMTVQPDEEAEGFYERLGFNMELFTGRIVRVPGKGKGQTTKRRFSWEDVKELELVAGHFQSSYSMWFSAFKDNIAGIHYTLETGRSSESYYAIRNLPGRKGCALLLWGRLEDLSPVLKRTGDLGFNNVLTTVPMDVMGLGAEKIREIKILGKKLN
ncbi:GNAT family N-acetyltransferase [Thermococcus sp.]